MEKILNIVLRSVIILFFAWIAGKMTWSYLKYESYSEMEQDMIENATMIELQIDEMFFGFGDMEDIPDNIDYEGFLWSVKTIEGVGILSGILSLVLLVLLWRKVRLSFYGLLIVQLIGLLLPVIFLGSEVFFREENTQTDFLISFVFLGLISGIHLLIKWSEKRLIA